MPIKVKVTLTPEARDPYFYFKRPYAKELLERFKNGAVLKVWRCSSPWNYYLEDADGQHMITGCWELEALNEVNANHLRALQRLARPDGNSPEVIKYSLSRFERGMAQSSAWVYDAERAKQAEALWAETCLRRAERAVNPKKPQPLLSVLSERALALLRTLKNGGTPVCWAPELDKEFSELDAQGLLDMRQNGHFRLAAGLHQLRLPRGQQLTLVPA